MSTARPSQTSQEACTPVLTPGPYRVSAELQGFKKVQRDNVEVRVGDRLEIDFKMEVGGLTEVVNVAAETRCSKPAPARPGRSSTRSALR